MEVFSVSNFDLLIFLARKKEEKIKDVIFLLNISMEFFSMSNFDLYFLKTRM